MLAAITILCLLIAVTQGYYLLKNKLVKEFVVLLSMIAVTLFYSYNVILHWKLPTPDYLFTKVFDPISRLVFGRN